MEDSRNLPLKNHLMTIVKLTSEFANIMKSNQMNARVAQTNFIISQVEQQVAMAKQYLTDEKQKEDDEQIRNVVRQMIGERVIRKNENR